MPYVKEYFVSSLQPIWRLDCCVCTESRPEGTALSYFRSIREKAYCCGRVLRYVHREPNIVHFYAQGAQHNTHCARALYHRKPINKRRAYK